MGTIHAYPFIRRYQGTATDHVVHLRRGSVAHAGVGQTFWFAPNSAVISEVPAADRERPVLVHAVTRDQQNVTVQAVLTYRFTDPELAARRLDFGIHPPRRADTRHAGADQVDDLVGQLSQSVVVDVLATMDLAEALVVGIGRCREALRAELGGQPRLTGTGIEVSDVRVLSLRPEADVEKALQTPLREQLQAEADRALYERRALAVEREQQISERELASKIELATRRERLVAQEGANERRTAEEKAAHDLIEAKGDAQTRSIASQARAAEIAALGRAENDTQKELMGIYASVGAEVLSALALREAAQNLPSIGQVTVTPDLLSGVLSKVAGGTGTAAAAPGAATAQDEAR